MTAIEAVLPDKQLRSPEVLEVIDSLIETLSTHGGDGGNNVKATVKSVLREDKYESITRLGAQLAKRLPQSYGGKPAEQYFRYAYKIRSA